MKVLLQQFDKVQVFDVFLKYTPENSEICITLVLAKVILIVDLSYRVGLIVHK